MDKLHDSRKQFEEWVMERAIKANSQFLHGLIDFQDDRYLVSWVDSAWGGWQASRASIVVDLPEMEDFELLDGYKVRESLRSIGLSIKGE